LAAIGVIAGMVFAGMAIKGYLDPFDDHTFVQSVWEAAEPHHRAPMARDVTQRLPIGMTADDVRNLLGPSTPVVRYAGAVDKFGNPMKYPETWSYYLGSWSGYGLDDAFLYVHFDAEKKVASVKITGG
jgi:hypothetical protein